MSHNNVLKSFRHL